MVGESGSMIDNLQEAWISNNAMSHPQHFSPSLQRRDYPRLWSAPPPALTNILVVCPQ